jgi:hypothetical protein
MPCTQLTMAVFALHVCAALCQHHPPALQLVILDHNMLSLAPAVARAAVLAAAEPAAGAACAPIHLDCVAADNCGAHGSWSAGCSCSSTDRNQAPQGLCHRYVELQ